MRRFLPAGLKSGGFLALYLAIAIFVLIGTAWLLLVIAEDVTLSEPITTVDARFSNWLQTHQSSEITAFMLFITRIHSLVCVDLAALVIIVYWWFRRLRYWALTLALAVYGGSVLNFVLKNLFERARPRFEHPLVFLTSYSFPSGHTLAATVFYGTLCAFAVSRLRGWGYRPPAAAASIFMISLVGFSRIYLGAHYLSDIIAALIEGLGWLAICLIGVIAIQRRDLARPESV